MATVEPPGKRISISLWYQSGRDYQVELKQKQGLPMKECHSKVKATGTSTYLKDSTLGFDAYSQY